MNTTKELQKRVVNKYISDTMLKQFYPDINIPFEEFSSHKFNSTLERVLLSNEMEDTITNFVEVHGEANPSNYNHLTKMIMDKLFFTHIVNIYNGYHKLQVRLLDYRFRLNNSDAMYDALSKYHFIKKHKVNSKRIKSGIDKVELPTANETERAKHVFITILYDEMADEIVRSGSLKTIEQLEQVKMYFQKNIKKHADNLITKPFIYDVVELRELDIKEDLQEQGLLAVDKESNLTIESGKEFDLFLQGKISETKLKEFYPKYDYDNTSNFYSKSFTFAMLKYLSNPFVKSQLSEELKKIYNTKTLKEILENQDKDDIWKNVLKILYAKHIPRLDKLYEEVTNVPIYSRTGMEFDRVLPFNQFTLGNINLVRMYLGTNLFIQEYVPHDFLMEQVIELHEPTTVNNRINELDYLPIYISTIYDVFGDIISNAKLGQKDYIKNEILATFDMDKQLDILNQVRNKYALDNLAKDYFNKLKSKMNLIERMGGSDDFVQYDRLLKSLVETLQVYQSDDLDEVAFTGILTESKPYTVISLTMNYMYRTYKNEFLDLLERIKHEHPNLDIESEQNKSIILNNYLIPTINEKLEMIDHLNNGKIEQRLKPFIVKYGYEVTEDREFQGINLGLFRFNYMVNKIGINYTYPSMLIEKFAKSYASRANFELIAKSKVPEKDIQRMQRSEEFININKEKLAELGLSVYYVHGELSLKIIVPYKNKRTSDDYYLIDVRPYQCTVRSYKNPLERHTITSQNFDNTPSFILKDILFVLHRMMSSRKEIDDKYRDITLMIVNKIYNLQYKNLTL